MKLLTTLLPTILSLLILLLHPLPATADTHAELQRSARHALSHLYATTPAAKALGEKAAGVLVFPEILKGGFIVAAQYGNGVLFKQGKPAGYYNTTSGSFGFQAGVQTFGYALFFMTKKDLHYLDTSAGWELGVGPSITIVDVGLATSLSTTTARKGVYAFFFDQKGLMGGIGLQGTKITKTHPK
jgi:lipid-binding SYLF domain-containing protein